MIGSLLNFRTTTSSKIETLTAALPNTTDWLKINYSFFVSRKSIISIKVLKNKKIAIF